MGQTSFPTANGENSVSLCCTPEGDSSLEKQTSRDTCDTQRISVKSCPEPIACQKSAVTREKRSGTTRTYRPARIMRSQTHSDPPSMKDRSFRKSRSRFKPSHPPEPSLRRQGKTRTCQGRQPSVLVRRNNGLGDAQASPPHERNDSDDNPIDTIVRRIQEAGHYVESLFRARVKAFAASMKGRLRK